MNSAGGRIVDAINIGHAVRTKRFLTVAGSVCASACTFIWLAGVERGAFDDSAIGFHSAYITNGDKAEVSSSGNAVVGAYLTKLGFGYNAIIYFTQAAPDEAEWFNFAKARELGIKMTRLQGTKQAAQPHQMKPQQQQQAQQQPAADPQVTEAVRKHRCRQLGYCRPTEPLTDVREE